MVAVVATSGMPRFTAVHSHARGQLLGATKGLITVEMAQSRWLVPATHAVWIPPDVPHGLHTHGPFDGWSIYVAPTLCQSLPAEACTLAMSGLLREATARAASWGDGPLDAAQQRLAAVMVDEMTSLPQVALGLQMPGDARLLKIARALSERPADERKLEDWAAYAGVSPRSLSRRFVAETGFTLTQWRQRVRLLRALELLAAGQSVKEVALNLGYDNVSGFITLFARTFGSTPGRFQETAQGKVS